MAVNSTIQARRGTTAVARWLASVAAVAIAAGAAVFLLAGHGHAQAAPTFEILGYPVRNNDVDDEFRADVAFTVPKGELPTRVAYDSDGNGTMNAVTVRNTGQFPGINQEYQIVRVDSVDAATDRVTIRVQGDATNAALLCQPTISNLALEATFPSGVATVPLPTEVWPFQNCPGVGRPVIRIPWDAAWPGMSPNSQAGWGAITFDGTVTPTKFVIDPSNLNLDADCGITTNGWYQFVKQDGSPTLATPAPVPFTVTDHTSSPANAFFITSPVDLSADGDGYYKLLAWADATASVPLDCTARGWDPTDPADAWQIGSVFVVMASMSKEFADPSFVIGTKTRLTYTIDEPALIAQSGVAFTDTLPSGLVVAAPPNTTNTCGGTLSADAGSSTISLSGAALPAGPSTCTIAVDITNSPTFTTAASCPDPALTNEAANISGLSAHLDLADDFGACVSTTVEADLVTAKVALNTTPVVPGGTFDYQVTVTNNGPSPAANVRATDDLPAALSFVSSVDGCTAEGQVVSCPPVDVVPAGSSTSWTFSVRLDPGYTGDGSDLGNVAVADADTADPSPGNNANPSPALPSGGVASPSADLTTDKVALNTAPVVPGTTFDYQVTVTNNGPSNAANVTATDDLPTALAFVSGTGCSATAQTVTCGPEPELAPGASRSWTFTVRLDSGYTGDGSDLGNVAVADADTADPSPDNNANPSPALPSGGVASPAADLTTAKVALNTAPVVPGTTFDYQVTVTNNGPSNAANVTATDDLPTALAFVTGTGCSAISQSVTCGPEPELAPGASRSWTFTVRLDPGYTGDGSDLGNIAVADADTADPSPGNNANPSPALPSGGVASPSADLTTAKVALNTTPVVPGTTFDYQVTVTNNGPSTATNVTATDDLPTALAFVSGTGCSAAGQTVTCGPEPVLAPGASRSWTFTVRLDPGYTGDGSDLGNVAVADADTADPSPGNNANPSPALPSGGVASPAADLTTAKVALNTTPVVPGTTFDYQVTVTSNGPSTAANVTATDDLPTALTFVSGTGCSAADQTVTCGPQPTLTIGATATWTFTVRLDPGYTGDGSDLGNIAVADADTADPSPGNNANPSPALPSGGVAPPAADLTTEKVALNTTPVVPGGTFDYQVTVTNNGPSVATNVSATDDLPTALAFVSGTGCSAVGQAVTCGPQATLAVGATVSWTFTVRLDAGYTGDGSDLGNVAVADADTADPSPGNNANASPALPSGGVASPSADLTTQKVALNTTPVVPGTTFDYQVTVTNNGPSVATNVTATDDLPTALAFVSGTGCSAVAQSVTCGPEPTLAVGATVSWTFTVRLDTGYTGDGSDLGNVAVADADTADPSPGNNANPSPALPSGGVASPSADLTTEKVALNTAPVVPGTTFDYQVTVTNNGPSVATNVSAADELPTALTFVSGTGCSAAGQSVICGPQATLAVGATVSWTFTVRLDAGYTGDGSDLGNIAVADADTADPSPGNNANPSPALPSGGVASPSADLTTEKVALNTAPVVPGTTFDYQVTVTNNGPSVATNVTATDDLPTALAFVSGTGCSAVAQSVTCGPEPTLAVGATVSWTFTVRLDSGYTGDGSDLGNIAVADADTADPSPGNNANPSPALPSGGVAPPTADLTTAKVALNTTPVVPGTTFDYQVTVTNNGPSTATNVTATDDLPTALAFVSGTGCSAADQTVTCGPEPTLAVGATMSWTFTVRLDTGYTGDGSDLGNIAVADADTADPSPGNNANPSPALPSGGVAPPTADLTTAKVALNTTPVVPGTTFDYQVTVTNNGPSTATNVTATDDLPTALTFVTSTACSATAQTVTCGPQPTLTIGATATWTFTVRLDPGYTGDGSDLGNIAVADADTTDPSPGNNANPSPAFPSGGPGSPTVSLSTAKEVSTAPVGPGQTFTYTITTTNSGPSTAMNARATDPLPTPITFVSSLDGCSAAGQTVTCGPEPELAPGASRSWTFTVRLDSGYTGDGSDLGNVATSTSDTSGGQPQGPSSPVFPQLVSQSDVGVTIEITSPISSTGTVTQVVTNYGPWIATAVTTTVVLPEGLSRSGDALGADCTGTTTVTCVLPDPPALRQQRVQPVARFLGGTGVERLAPQETATITFPVELDGTCRTGEFAGSASVTVAHIEPDSNLANDADSADTVFTAGGDCVGVVPVTGLRVGLHAFSGLLILLLGMVLVRLGSKPAKRNSH